MSSGDSRIKHGEVVIGSPEHGAEKAEETVPPIHLWTKSSTGKPGDIRLPRPKPKTDVYWEVVFESWVQKQTTPQGNPGVLRWRKRYLILDAERRELRYYAKVAASRAGVIPLDERCSIPLETIRALKTNVDNTANGCRFDLHVDRFFDASAKYPRAFASEGQTSLENVVVSFIAPDEATRHRWTVEITKRLPPGVVSDVEGIERLPQPRKVTIDTHDDGDQEKKEDDEEKPHVGAGAIAIGTPATALTTPAAIDKEE